MVIVIMGIIAAIAAPKFADAGSGRRLSAGQSLIEKDIDIVKLRARATGKLHLIVFYPDEDMYVVFEGTAVDRDAIVMARSLDDSTLQLDLSRTNIGGNEDIVVSELGQLEKNFTVGIMDQGIEKLISFTGVGFTRPSVSHTDSVLEINSGVLNLSVGGRGLSIGLGL